jgi:hypothetical protein
LDEKEKFIDGLCKEMIKKDKEVSSSHLKITEVSQRLELEIESMVLHINMDSDDNLN